MNSLKTVLVTGATGAIGYSIAELMATKHEYKVVILARNEQKAMHAVEKIKVSTGKPTIEYCIADVSRKSEIENLAAHWAGPLDILINNAATTPRSREETPEGIEMQWATNVLGYFWMMKYFAKHLENSDDSRIINVASYWAGGLDLQDPEFKKRPYDNDMAYRQSKQADRMLSLAFAIRLSEKGISVNACHPGDVRSRLASNLGFGGHESPEQGAATPVWLASSPDLKGVSGKYFEHLKQINCRFCTDSEAIEQLYTVCKNS